MTNNVVNEIILTGEKLKKMFGFFKFARQYLSQ